MPGHRPAPEPRLGRRRSTVSKGKRPYITLALAAVFVAAAGLPTLAQSTEDKLEEAKRRLAQVEADEITYDELLAA